MNHHLRKMLECEIYEELTGSYQYILDMWLDYLDEEDE